MATAGCVYCFEENGAEILLKCNTCLHTAHVCCRFCAKSFHSAACSECGMDDIAIQTLEGVVICKELLLSTIPLPYLASSAGSSSSNPILLFSDVVPPISFRTSSQPPASRSPSPQPPASRPPSPQPPAFHASQPPTSGQAVDVCNVCFEPASYHLACSSQGCGAKTCGPCTLNYKQTENGRKCMLCRGISTEISTLSGNTCTLESIRSSLGDSAPQQSNRRRVRRRVNFTEEELANNDAQQVMLFLIECSLCLF